MTSDGSTKDDIKIDPEIPFVKEKGVKKFREEIEAGWIYFILSDLMPLM